MTNQIVFIGPTFNKPKGGVASVLAEYKKIYPKAYFVASTNSKNLFTKIWFFISGVAHLIFLMLFKRHIKIVHIHGASNGSFYRKYFFFKISKLFGKKIIYHIHGGGFQNFYINSRKLVKRLIEDFINCSDGLICLSNSWEEYFKLNFSPKKISIIPNIIAEPSSGFIKPIKTKTIRKFLYLGIINKNKGIWLLLDVLNEHKKELEGKVIFYLGGNGETTKLKLLIQKFELNDIVKFIGWVSGTDKQNQLLMADVFILPSFIEGLPISILEGMSYGLPILSTTVGGIPEIVTPSNGVLCEPSNKKELWSAIKFFIDVENVKLNEMGEASLKLIKPHLPEAVHYTLNKFYESLLC